MLFSTVLKEFVAFLSFKDATKRPGKHLLQGT
jgi:hypothetical protein